MTPFRLIPLLVLTSALCGCLGRNLPEEEDSGYSNLSTVQPADWEYRKSLPGQP